MRRLPISCFIIAKNEADRIGRTIRAVRDWVDEVVVVDSGSTDRTQQVAAAEGARVVFNAWPGFGQQKRFGESLCRNDWVMNVDADEVVTPGMREEVSRLFAAGPPPRAGYYVPIYLVYPGHTRPRPWVCDHRYIRLYDKRRMRFRDSSIHDSVDPQGHQLGRLRNGIHHFSVRSIDDFLRKCHERSSYNAAHSKKMSRFTLALRLVLEFPGNFLKFYFLRGHFTGGLMGVQYAMILAFYRFMRIVRLYQASLPLPPQSQDADPPRPADDTAPPCRGSTHRSA